MLPAATGGSPITRPLDVTVHETTEDQRIRIMIDEVADLTRAMRELLMTADRFVYLGGLVAAAALTLGVVKYREGDNWVILVFAPYGLAIALGYLIQVYTEVERRAGYKAYLEERINAMVSEPLLLDSHVNSRKKRNRLSVVGLQLLNLSGFAGLVWMSGHTTWEKYAHGGPILIGHDLLTYHGLNLFFLILATATLATAAYENWRASRRAMEAAAKAYDVLSGRQ
jgi:hypothetical protein